MNVKTAVSEFLLASQADGKRPKTIVWYRAMLKPFGERFPNREVGSITPSDIRQYIVDLQNRKERYSDAKQKPVQPGGLSEYSIDSHKRAIFALFGWVARELSIADPTANIKRPKRRPTAPKAISASDFVKLFNATVSDSVSGKRDRALLAFLADTGCRLGGVIGLTLHRIDLQNRTAQVQEKGGKWRNVNFTYYTQSLLRQWIDSRGHVSEVVFTSVVTGEQLTDSGVNQILKRLKARAGVTGRVNPHSFRHAFAREYIANGGDLATLSKILGHSDITVTAMHYAIFLPEELADFHAKHTPMNSLALLLEK